LLVQLLWAVVLILIVLLLLIGLLYKIVPFKRVTVFEGWYSSTLSPGQYWVFPAFSSIIPVDVRPEFITIVGQDVLSTATFGSVTSNSAARLAFNVTPSHVASF
jgi:hypothetical protein